MIRVNISSVSEATITKVFSGSGRTENEQIVDRPYFQHTGFTSIPKANTKGVADVQGNRVFLIATSDTQADRPVLSSETDVAIYADADKYIKIEADGKITLANDNGTIVLEANGQVNINSGNLTVDP